MTLQKWLTKEGVDVGIFATSIGVAKRSVYRYLSGETRPVPRVMVRIHAATRGMVTANDFYPKK